MDDPFYFKHIIFTVFWSKEYYVKELLDKGYIVKWLESKNDQYIQIITNLLSITAHKLPEEIYYLLGKYIDTNKKNNEIALSSLPQSILNDTDELFSLRIKLLDLGFFNPYRIIYWDQLIKEKPSWCINILLSILKNRNSGHDNFSDHVLFLEDIETQKNIIEIVQVNANDIWNKFLPAIKRLVIDTKDDHYLHLNWISQLSENSYYTEFTFENLCIDLLLASANKLAQSNSTQFLDELNNLENNTNIVFKSIFWTSLQYLDIEHSDYCIDKITTAFPLNEFSNNNMELFIINILKNLITKFSNSCSENNYKLLNDRILMYIEKYNKKTYKDVFQGRLKGYSDYYHGKIQHLLLPSLPTNRISKNVKNEIEVLKRKFGDKNIDDFYNYKIRSGIIDSSLSPNIEKISDKAWLNLIKRGVNKTKKSWIQYSDDVLHESSEKLFSVSFSNISKKYPQRFFNIALNFPSNVSIVYVNAIISAASKKEPDKNDIEDWKPISIDDISIIIKKYLPTKDYQTAQSFLRLIQERSNENWSNDIIDLVLLYSEEYIESEENTDENLTVQNLNSITLNDVQCIAISFLGSLLYTNKKYLPMCQSVIKKLISNKNIKIQSALVDILLPLLNYQRDDAFQYFLTIVKNNDIVLTIRRSMHFLNYTIKEYHEKISPILYKMTESKNDEISKISYLCIFAYSFFHNIFTDFDIEISKLDEKTKIEFVHFLSQQIDKDSYFDRSLLLLEVFFNDDSDEIRKAASRCISYDFKNQEHLKKLLLSFVKSKAFSNHFSIFYRILKDDYFESLNDFKEIIFLACDNILSNELENIVNLTEWGHLTELLFPILLRLYDENLKKDTSISSTCLDYIDQFMFNRIGFDGINKKLLDDI